MIHFVLVSRLYGTLLEFILNMALIIVHDCQDEFGNDYALSKRMGEDRLATRVRAGEYSQRVKGI